MNDHRLTLCEAYGHNAVLGRCLDCGAATSPDEYEPSPDMAETEPGTSVK